HSPFAIRHLHTFSFPRRNLRPGLVTFPSSTPIEGWRSAETARGCSGTRCVPKRGTPSCVLQREDARLSALHRGDFGPGPVLPSPAFPPDPCSELLAAGS